METLPATVRMAPIQAPDITMCDHLVSLVRKIIILAFDILTGRIIRSWISNMSRPNPTYTNVSRSDLLGLGGRPGAAGAGGTNRRSGIDPSGRLRTAWRSGDSPSVIAMLDTLRHHGQYAGGGRPHRGSVPAEPIRRTEPVGVAIAPTGVAGNAEERFTRFIFAMAGDHHTSPLEVTNQDNSPLLRATINIEERKITLTRQEDAVVDAEQPQEVTLTYNLAGQLTEVTIDGGDPIIRQHFQEGGQYEAARVYLERAISATEQSQFTTIFTEIAEPLEALTPDDLTVMARIMKQEAERGPIGTRESPRFLMIGDNPEHQTTFIAYYRRIRTTSDRATEGEIIIQPYESYRLGENNNVTVLKTLDTPARHGRAALFEVTHFTTRSDDGNGNVQYRSAPDTMRHIGHMEGRLFDKLFCSVVPKMTQIRETYGEVAVTTVQSGIQRAVSDQVFQFDRVFRQQLANRAQVGLRVIFLTPSLEAEPGADAGGPSRQYITEVFEAVAGGKDPNYRLKTRGEGQSQMWFVTPNKVVIDPETGVAELPRLTSTNANFYIALGSMIKFVQQSNGRFVAGSHWDEAMYSAILDLSGEDLRGGVNSDIPQEAQLKILKHLAASAPDSTALVQSINACLKRPEDVTAEEKILIQAAAQIENVDFEGNGEPRDGGGSHPGLTEGDNWEEAKRCVIYSAIAGHGREVEPIFRIAQGMAAASVTNRAHSEAQQVASWNAFVTVQGSPQTRGGRLQTTIQGLLDREQVASAIRGYNGANLNSSDSLRVKVDWIREWIRSEATEIDKVKAFLRFVTGSASLNTRNPPTINPTTGIGVLPNAHTCFHYMDLNPNHLNLVNSRGEVLVDGSTYEGFTQILERTIFGAAGHLLDGR